MDTTGEGSPAGLGPDEKQDIAEVVAEHLAEGWVAIFLEAGAEKLRYIHGSALAVNGNNDRWRVNLTEIYALAEDLGSNVTEAES